MTKEVKQEQDEPVAYINVEQRRLEWAKYTSWETPTVVNLQKIPLYTTPQPKQEQDEPVAEVVEGDDFSKQVIGIGNWRTLSNGTKLYTTPQRKPLTMTELSKIFASIPNVPFDGEWHLELVRAIEAAHGIKEYTHD